MMKIIAHRGASGLAPENTLPAIDLAWELGADGVEVDVRLTRDGVPVLHHDRFLPWWSGLRGPIDSMRHKDILRADVGRLRGFRFRGTRIPTLEEAWEHIPAGKEFWVEIKPHPGQRLRWLQVAREYSRCPGLRWISFDPYLLLQIREALPEARLWWVLSHYLQVNPDFLQVAEPLLERLRPEGLDYGAKAGIPPWLEEAQEKGLQTSVWTVDHLDLAAKWMQSGCHYLTTNHPERFRKLRIKNEE